MQQPSKFVFSIDIKSTICTDITPHCQIVYVCMPQDKIVINCTFFNNKRNPRESTCIISLKVKMICHRDSKANTNLSRFNVFFFGQRSTFLTCSLFILFFFWDRTSRVGMNVIQNCDKQQNHFRAYLKAFFAWHP